MFLQLRLLAPKAKRFRASLVLLLCQAKAATALLEQVGYAVRGTCTVHRPCMVFHVSPRVRTYKIFVCAALWPELCS